jgi:transcriptional regulator GlxA family with amidase domain
MRVDLIALPGCHAGAVGMTGDLFHVANQQAGETLIEWRVLSQDGGDVRAASGQRIAVDGALAAGVGDVALLPSLFYPGRAAFTRWLAEQVALYDWLRWRAEQGALLAAGCTGVFPLAESGVLDGHEVTLSWWLARHFEQRYPQIRLRLRERLVESGQRMTAGSGVAYNDLLLRLIARACGDALARQVGRLMLIGGDASPQGAFIELGIPERCDDPLVERALTLMHSRLARPLDLSELAAELAVSPRTLNRRCKAVLGETPQACLQRLRVEAAKRLLSHSRQPLGEVVEQVGYRDPAAFRRLFMRFTGLTPAAYRKRFSSLAE